MMICSILVSSLRNIFRGPFRTQFNIYDVVLNIKHAVTEAATGGVLQKKCSQNSQENTCARASGTGVFL